MKLDALFEPLVAKLRGWVQEFVVMLPNLVAAIAVLVLFMLAARWLAAGVRGGLRHFMRHAQAADLLAKIVRALVLAAGLFAALGILKLDKTVTSLLAGVGIVGLALGFAFQDIAANFMSGILMAIRRPFEEGTSSAPGTSSAASRRSSCARLGSRA